MFYLWVLTRPIRIGTELEEASINKLHYRIEMFLHLYPWYIYSRSYQTNCRSYIAGNGLVFLYKWRGIIFSTCGEELCSLHALKVERIVISLECFGKNCNLYRSKVEKENVSSKWCATNSVNCYEVVESNLNYTLFFLKDGVLRKDSFPALGHRKVDFCKSLICGFLS